MPSTKRQPVTPATPATSQTRPATPAALAAELPKTHDMIIDAVTELLTHGGHADDVTSLLCATMRHTHRRTLSPVFDDPKKLTEHASEFAKGNFEDWKGDLVASWRRNRRPERVEFDPKTVTERIRHNLREDLRNQFEKFMADASVEEQRFLFEVFVQREGAHRPAECQDTEVYIADAFSMELQDGHWFVRVPTRLTSQVEQFVATLVGIEKAAAK